jgi:hypothetical protein
MTGDRERELELAWEDALADRDFWMDGAQVFREQRDDARAVARELLLMLGAALPPHEAVIAVDLYTRRAPWLGEETTRHE